MACVREDQDFQSKERSKMERLRSNMNGAHLIMLAAESTKTIKALIPIKSFHHSLYHIIHDSDFEDLDISDDLSESERDILSKQRLKRRNAVQIDNLNLQRRLESYIVLKNLSTLRYPRISCCNRKTANPSQLCEFGIKGA